MTHDDLFVHEPLRVTIRRLFTHRCGYPGCTRRKRLGDSWCQYHFDRHESQTG